MTLFFCLALSACSSKKKSATTEEVPPKGGDIEEPAKPEHDEPVAATSPDLFDVAGYGGTVSVAIWPEHWSKMNAAATAMIAELPEAMRSDAGKMRDALVGNAGPWQALSLLSGQVGLGAMPETIPGLDTGRPIVASLMRPLGDFEHLAQKLLSRKEPAFAGMHSRIVLPADDSHAALSAISKALQTSGFKSAGPAKHKELLRNESMVVRLLAAKLWLSVDIVSGRALEKLDMEALDDPTPKHAADKLFSDGPAAVARVQLRYRKMEAAGGYLGMTMVAGALAEVGDDILFRVFAAGYSEVLSMPALMDPRGRVTSDGILEISASDKAQVHGVFALSKSGAAALSAGLKAGDKPKGLPELAWGEVFKLAPVSPALDKGSASRAADLFHEAGIAATLYAASANMISAGRLWIKMQTADVDAGIKDLLKEAPPLAALRLSLRDDYLVVSVFGDESRFLTESLDTITHTAPSEAENCYRDMQIQARKAMGALAGMADKSMSREVLLTAIADTKDKRACAEKSEVLKDRVSTLHTTLVMLSEKFKKTE